MPFGLEDAESRRVAESVLQCSCSFVVFKLHTAMFSK